MTQWVIVAGLIYAVGCKDRCIRYPTFFPLFLTLTTGLSGAFLTADLFNLFVFAELLVASGAVLTAISDDEYGAEAAYKYFLISLFGSIFLLGAVAVLYTSYGTLNMADLAQRITAQPDMPLTPLAMALMFAFFMVKSAVAPFHFWQPDFHTTAPTAVSAMLSSVVVKLGVYGFIRMTTLLFTPWAAELRSLLVVLGVAGVIFGGFTALGTHNAKRMLAYSTLSQIGFILVGIGWGTPLGLTAAVVMTFNHSLIKSALLMLAGAMASRAPIKTASFTVLTGLGKATPLGGALFLLGGLALAGIPPLNGFVSKLALFRSGIEAGAYAPLATLGVASILTLLYVMRAFQRIWWQPAAEGAQAKPDGDRLLAPALLIGLCMVLGIWGEPLIVLAGDVAASLATPGAYIAAILGG
jgi:multicomponent Na+:H+ antiporter subunit D